MDNLTTLFVVPTGNTIPTTGGTQNLTGTQFGIFLPTLVPATAVTAASAKYLYMAQGRNIYSPNEGTRTSDFIYPKNLVDWYKVAGSLKQSFQVTQISALNVGCNEDVSITIRLDSYYIRQAYANGLTRSVMTTTPCCDCGSDPCSTLTSDQVQTVMEQLAQNINDDELLSQFVVAGVSGTGLSTIIMIEGLPLTNYINNGDLTNFPYQYDRLSFWTFVRTGPELTTDYEVDDACDVVATVTILQRASYPQNTPAEIKQMELDYWSYQAEYKNIFSNVNYNGEFQSYVDSALAYDLYYLRFLEPLKPDSSPGKQPLVETVILAIPAGDASEAGTLAILTAAFGTPVNETATASSTTTFTTSSTSTSTTVNTTTP